MVVKMREITVLVANNDIDPALGSLRCLGAVHVEHIQKPHADYIDTVVKRIARVDKVLEIIPEAESEKKKTLKKKELAALSREITGLNQRRKELEKLLKELNQKASWLKEWGDVSIVDLNKLRRENIFVKLYLCGRKDLLRVEKDKLVYIIGREGQSLRVAHISKDKEESLGLPASAKEIQPPRDNLCLVDGKINQVQEEIKKIEEKLNSFSVYRGCFQEYKKNLLDKLEFIKVKFGMGRNQDLAWLRGYCPVNRVEKLKKAASEKGWGFVAAKPDKPEEVPTLLRNPRWVEIIKPVFNFMGTLPGYKEYDISFWFLLFFSLFFAMLVGDAGYGLFFLGATYFLRRKFRKAPAAPFFLFYLLSSVTIIWGALSGNWFGAEAIAKLPFFSSLIVERINSFVQENQNFMIYLSFVIGVVHLSIAHLIKAFKYINSSKAIAETGWVCILWAAFFVAGNLVLNRPIPAFALPMGAAGIAGVILFSNFQKNILKGALSSLGSLPLDIVSSFSDIVSYLRLFAVGYATLAVASAFNQMAIGAGIQGFISGLAAALVLFLGHGLNILLCLMSVIVHGIRLNMLEFSGQLGMEWSGKEYRPFK